MPLLFANDIMNEFCHGANNVKPSAPSGQLSTLLAIPYPSFGCNTELSIPFFQF